MNGIEKITARIDADTQAEIDRILGDAHAQAEAIAAKYRSQAAAEDADLLARNQKAAAERERNLPIIPESVRHESGNARLLRRSFGKCGRGESHEQKSQENLSHNIHL